VVVAVDCDDPKLNEGATKGVVLALPKSNFGNDCCCCVAYEISILGLLLCGLWDYEVSILVY
jgi:hypothetical protein